MTDFLERFPAHTQVGEVFELVHNESYSLAQNIPVFDGENRDEPYTGEVYAHSELNKYPIVGMYDRNIMVRVSTEHGAPYVLEVIRTHHELLPDVLLAGSVFAYNDSGTSREAWLTRSDNRERLVSVTDLETFGTARHRSVTEVDKLKSRDRARLDKVATIIATKNAAIRCLVSVDMATSADTTTSSRNLLAARASFKDVFRLLQSNGAGSLLE